MEGKIKMVKLESGDSGYEVCCYCAEKSAGGGMYEPMTEKKYEFFFSEDDSAGAFSKFEELDKLKKGEE